jgi:hypothetical protein
VAHRSRRPARELKSLRRRAKLFRVELVDRSSCEVVPNPVAKEEPQRAFGLTCTERGLRIYLGRFTRTCSRRPTVTMVRYTVSPGSAWLSALSSSQTLRVR